MKILCLQTTRLTSTTVVWNEAYVDALSRLRWKHFVVRAEQPAGCLKISLGVLFKDMEGLGNSHLVHG